MNTKNENTSFLKAFLVVVGVPVIAILLGDFQKRTLLKDFLSLLTIVSFCLLAGQFYWCIRNRSVFDGKQIRTVGSIHNTVGYLVVCILFFHPLFLVLPRFFEDGMTPVEAFSRIVTTFSSSGIVLGLVSWGAMVILWLTSLFRKKLPIQYKTWRTVHGILSSLFLITATMHAVDLGRHFNTFLTSVFTIYCILALLQYAKEILLKIISSSRRKQHILNNEYITRN